ncbi:hypothetical protein [Aquabacter sediminis]|uniref:hypothetical protein n=1 Tax=Aquabacter sediminis TaxID=3029197 RepID=UPI00237D69F4|nr:hypothetical protein [Aquabacter sp. P-9]MDE1571150.1 hypothetical protein [Aquabacter sp. P-9]
MNDNLISIFEPHYEFFGRQPELSRIILREMLFYGSGQQATRYRQNRVRLMNLISQPFRFGMKAGTVRQDVDADTLGWIAFAIFQVELRRWIAEPAQDLNEGIVRLRTELAIFESGFALR